MMENCIAARNHRNSPCCSRASRVGIHIGVPGGRMTRRLAHGLAVLVPGVVGAGIWAVHADPFVAEKRLVTLPSASSSDDSNPGYPVRLTLPQARPWASFLTTTSQADLLPAEPSDAPANAMPADAFDQPLARFPEPAPSTRAGEFSAAFASRSAVTDLKFDISTFGRTAPAKSERSIVAEKAVSLGGKALGAVELSLGHGSVVAVGRRDLQSLVAGKDEGLSAALAAMEGDLVSFDALRDRGVRIRYDALADTVVIDESR